MSTPFEPTPLGDAEYYQITSTLLARLVTPVMYKLAPPAVEVARDQPGSANTRPMTV